MFSHVVVGVKDLEVSRKFYDALLGTLGIAPGFAKKIGISTEAQPALSQSPRRSMASLLAAVMAAPSDLTRPRQSKGT